eukprot:scaffold7807_cov95-Skeletonema_dohrnii-CCMP3373.AAC.1
MWFARSTEHRSMLCRPSSRQVAHEVPAYSVTIASLLRQFQSYPSYSYPLRNLARLSRPPSFHGGTRLHGTSALKTGYVN